MNDDPTRAMAAKPLQDFGPVLEAVSFAARAHKHQERKDGRTPYASHVFRVCLIIRHAFGIDDSRTLTAALLHDTVEDTTTDHDDIAERFGDEIAEWVGLLSKDKRLSESERETAYTQQVAQAPWQVKICKLGDVYDNLMDSVHMPADKSRTIANSQRYLDAIGVDQPEQIRAAYKMVDELLSEMQTRKSK